MDALRGLAMILVVSTHFLWIFVPNLVIGNFTAIDVLSGVPPFPFVNLLFPNILAVAVFCAVSGYVADPIREARPVQPLIHEVGRRYLRLVLPALAAGLVAFVMSGIFVDAAPRASAIIYGDSGYTWLTVFWSEPASVLDIAAEFLLGRSRTASATLPVLWMIADLFVGSVMVMCFTRWSAARSLSSPHAAGILGAVGLLFLFLQPLIAAVVLGAALHRLQRLLPPDRGKLVREKLAWQGLILVFAVLVGLNPAGSGTGGIRLQALYAPWIPEAAGAAATALAGVLIVHAAPLLLARVPRISSILAMVGIRSYSIFLLHLTIMLTASCATFVALQPALGGGVAVLLSALITMALIGVLSAWFYRWIEAPCVALLGTLTGRTPPPQTEPVGEL